MEAIQPTNPTETLDHQPASNNHIPSQSSDPSQTLVASENGAPSDANKPLTQLSAGTEVSLSGGEEETTTSRRRCRSRWDPRPDSETQGDDSGNRKRKSRWAAEELKTIVRLPDFMGAIEFDPEIQALNSRLLEISRMLSSGLPLDDRPDGARSPSPEPVYDNMGC